MTAPALTRRFYLAALAARTAAFLTLTSYALLAPDGFAADLTGLPRPTSPFFLCWLLLMASMVFRLFPSKLESLGCQKEFSGRFRPTGHIPQREERRRADRGALWVLLFWAAANVPFFLACAAGWVGPWFLVCLAGFYGVCDIVCILFFCPFQAWMMHNRCCTTCRIYDWDYLMLCTPLLALPSPLARSACGLAAVIFLRWEITYHRHRERFFESGNDALRCANCQEHLCRYKRSLAARLKRQA